MNKDQAIARMKEIITESKIGILSSSEDNVPNSRYMWFYNDGLTLYAKTNDQSPKYDELKKNPIAHILLGFEDSKDRAFIECLGNVEIIDDQELMNQLWEEKDKDFFDNKENPHLVALKITPEKMKIMNDDNSEPIEVQLEDEA